MEKLISIDLKSDFGFFRKPDANNTVNLSYNMLHKPALLGVFGAIVGLDGYKEKGKLPQYYEVFKDLKVGVAPLEHEKGNFQKTVIKYSNTVGYANNGSTYLTEESTLVKPSYRVYTLLDLNNDHQKLLYQYLKEGKAEYLPYFGKNEFSAWWENVIEYPVIKAVDSQVNIEIVSMMTLPDDNSNIVTNAIAKSISQGRTRLADKRHAYMFFERLPTMLDSIDEKHEKDSVKKYAYGELQKCVFTNVLINKDNSLDLDNMYKLGNNQVVQLI